MDTRKVATLIEENKATAKIIEYENIINDIFCGEKTYNIALYDEKKDKLSILFFFDEKTAGKDLESPPLFGIVMDGYSSIIPDIYVEIYIEKFYINKRNYTFVGELNNTTIYMALVKSKTYKYSVHNMIVYIKFQKNNDYCYRNYCKKEDLPTIPLGKYIHNYYYPLLVAAAKSKHCNIIKEYIRLILPKHFIGDLINIVTGYLNE